MSLFTRPWAGGFREHDPSRPGWKLGPNPITVDAGPCLGRAEGGEERNRVCFGLWAGARGRGGSSAEEDAAGKQRSHQEKGPGVFLCLSFFIFVF